MLFYHRIKEDELSKVDQDSGEVINGSTGADHANDMDMDEL